MSRNFRVEWNGPRVISLLGIGAMDGLEDAAEFLHGKSDARIPLETTELRETGEVSTDPARLKAAVSYDTEYAVAQHEKTYDHDPGRTRKFLEIPWLAERGEMARLIRDGIRRHWGL
jgi:hypothetical protein